MVLEVMLDKLTAPAIQAGTPQLDLCVTHDMTIFTMREGAGLEPVTGPDVKIYGWLADVRARRQGVFRQPAWRHRGS